MWTPATRRQHSRKSLRYETDLTDAEWSLIAPLLPASPARGRPHKWGMREIVNGIFYVLRGGVAWSLLPREFPPRSTVFHWFSAFRDTCLFEKINYALVIADRERVGREASPSAAIIDSQSVKTTESGGPPHRADVQDRDAGGPVLRASRSLFPFIKKLFADSAYDHERITTATSITLEIIRKIADQTGFVVLPRRWRQSAGSAF